MRHGCALKRAFVLIIFLLLMSIPVFSQGMNQIATYTDIIFYDDSDYVEGEIDLVESYVVYSHTYAITSTMYSPGFTRSQQNVGGHSSAPTYGSAGLALLDEDGTYRFDTSVEQWCDNAQQFSLIAGGTFNEQLQPFVKLNIIRYLRDDQVVAVLNGTDTNDYVILTAEVTVSTAARNNCSITIEFNLATTTGMADVKYDPEPYSGATAASITHAGNSSPKKFEIKIRNTSSANNGSVTHSGTIGVTKNEGFEPTIRIDSPPTLQTGPLTVSGTS
jgi:hypothetical protein